MRRLVTICIVVGALLLAMTAGPTAFGAGAHGAASTAAHVPDGADTNISLTPAETTAEAILFMVVDAGIVMLVLSFALCLMRLVRGPTLIDRGIATDTITLQVVGIAILLTISLRTLLYFDAVLIFAILGFATTVAFAQFIGRRRAV